MASLERWLRILRVEAGFPDERTLQDSIYQQRARAWRGKLSELARQAGSSKSGLGPRGRDQIELRKRSRIDASSVGGTFEKDFVAFVTKVYRENPDGDRRYYVNLVHEWSDTRAVWKDRQISLNNVQDTRQYAIDRFNEENPGRKAYRYGGPNPAECEDCQRHFIQGIVNQAYVDRHPQPQHPNCAHEWMLVSTSLINPQVVWTG